ncbi:MAG: penicillin acylase family protein [Alphaproteobacteria bacterium]|nr:penicillin acylase family protein [Alphaproteobacteria bacterium SS10]
MRIITGILAAFIGLILAIVVIGLPAAYIWFSTAQPDYDGDVLAGPLVSEPVTVVRDGYAIPHIFAANMDDAYVALGYLHAQDRLVQMEIQRRAGQGRLSELAGRLALPADRIMRSLGFYDLATQDFENGDPAAKNAVERYADGVNLFLAQNPDPTPPELHLIGLWNTSIAPHQPEPWKPADSVVWGKLIGLQLSGNMFGEIRRAMLADTLTPEQIAELTIFEEQDAEITLGSLRGLDDNGVDWARLEQAIPKLGPERASNVWALSGNRTATGRPILANDPHLGLSAPILWYLVRIVTPELTITGATVPGVPFHLMGQNGEAAWGLTTTGGDVQDLYIERLHPDDPNQYLTSDGFAEFETKTIEIGVAGDEAEQLTVRTTNHGLVISDLDDRLGPITGDDKVVTLRTTLMTPGDSSWESIFFLNRAKSWDQFTDAMARFKSGQQNSVFADKEGDIGLYSPALIPVRALGNGTVPMAGEEISDNWPGTVPVDRLPKILNPRSGQIINANNRLVGNDYPYFITHEWEPDYRAQRIAEELGGRNGLTVADNMALMVDPVSKAAHELLPYLTALEGETPLQRDVIAALTDWDGRMDRDLATPLIFSTWLRVMPAILLEDELGESQQWVGGGPRLVNRILGGDLGWCDDTQTDHTAEDCQAAAQAGLSRALSLLIDAYGHDWRQWRWGDAHQAPLGHQILGRLPLLGGLFRQDAALDGSNYTVLRAGGRGDDPTRFPVSHGAGYRAVYDLADLDNSRYMIATGQSGRPLSRHFDTFVDAWQAGDFITIESFRRGNPPSDALGEITFRPIAQPTTQPAADTAAGANDG